MQTLGGFAFRIGTDDVRPRPKKARALLGYLALSAREVGRDRLGALLWGDAPAAQARTSVRKSLSVIRSALGTHGERLETDGDGVRLSTDGLSIDAVMIQSTPPEADRATLEAALALYRGPLLESLGADEAAFDHWRTAEQERVRAAYETLVVATVERCRAEADEAGALRHALALVNADWTRESAHRLVMESYARLGQLATARAHYARLRTQLAASLGSEPSPDTVALFRNLATLRTGARPEEPDTSRPAPPASPDRRQVTAMFVGVGASEQDRPEERHAELAFLWQAGRAVAEEHGCDRVDVRADGLMALWGTRSARGVEAEWAVRAANAVQARLEGNPLLDPVRIGVATGLVVPSGEPAVPWVGGPLAMARRLASNAAPGAVRMCPDTEAGRRGEGRRAAFVGRTLERFHLRTSFEHALRRRKGSVVAVRGDAGVGKTRLCESLVREVEALGGAVVSLHASPFGEGDQSDGVRSLGRALWPILAEADGDALEVAVARCGLERARMLVGLDADGTPSDSVADPAAIADERRLLVVALLRGAAMQAPLLWLYEDVHWASAEELSDLRDVFDAVPGLPVLCVLTIRRDAEPDAPAWRAAIDRRVGTSLDLAPLDEDEARELVRSVVDDAPAELVDEIAGRAGGNPLFIEQLATRVAQSGSLHEVPATVRGLVLARLERMEAPLREGVELAAVAGPRARTETVSAVLGAERADRLCVDGWLQRDGRELRFAHALLRDAVYSAIHDERRQQLHLQLAAHYETRDLVRCAEHLAQGASPEAAACFLRAATQVRGEGRGPLALQLVEQGRACAPAPELSCELATLQADLLRTLNRAEQAQRAYVEARQLAQSPAQEAAVWLGEAELLHGQERREEAFERLELATRSLKRAPDDRLMARALMLRGNFHFPTGNYELCLEAQQRALELARETSDTHVEGRALSGLADAEFMGGDLRRAIDRFSGLIAFPGHGPSGVSLAHAMRGMAAKPLFALDDARRDLDAALESALSLEEPRAELIARHGLAMLANARGEHAGAKDEIARQWPLLERLSAWRFEPGAAAYAARAQIYLGEREAAYARLRAALRRSGAISEGFLLPVCLAELAATAPSAEERRGFADETRAALKAHRHPINVTAEAYASLLDVLIQETLWEDVAEVADEYEAYGEGRSFAELEAAVGRARVRVALARDPDDADARETAAALSKHLRDAGVADPRLIP